MKKRMNYFQGLKLQSKIKFTYLIVCTIPIIIMGIYAYSQSSRMVVQTETSKITNALLQAKYSMDNRIHSYENFGEYIAFNETVYQVINSPYSNHFDRYEKYTTLIDPLLLSVRYLDHSLQQITIYTDRIKDSHDTMIAPIAEVKSEGWYQEVSGSNQTLWVVEKGKRAVYARKMLTKTNSDAENILYLGIAYDALFQPLLGIGGENLGVLVTDKGGELIYEDYNFNERYEKYILSEAVGLKEGVLKINSADYMVSAQEIEGSNFNVYLYKPMKTIPREADKILMTMALIIIVSLFIMYGVGAGASYMIVKPIKKLTRNMSQVADGKMEVHVTSQSQDEVGIMIQSFGKMVQQISTLINENYKSKISLKEFEMKALQAQINPHFLYNSLSLINWKALQADEEDISKISLLLATFYRTTLNKGNSLTLVRDEMKNIESYLEIQLFMHDNSFDVVKEVSEEIILSKMPNLTLQPIVENAIHHGIDLKEDGRGVLTIRGWKEGQDIVLQVEDNGIGIEEELCKKLLSTQSSGYGVKNVNDRIRILYGESYHLTIHSVVGAGTLVNVRIPFES